MLSGGLDRDLLRPIDPADDSVLGSHQGPSEALNVRNPEPGFHYYYDRAKPSDVLRRLNEGWELVGAEHREQWGAELPEDVAKQLDGARAFKDVVLFRIPIEKYRELKRGEEALAKSARESTEQEYVDRGTRRGGAYHVGPEHTTYVEET